MTGHKLVEHIGLVAVREPDTGFVPRGEDGNRRNAHAADQMHGAAVVADEHGRPFERRRQCQQYADRAAVAGRKRFQDVEDLHGSVSAARVPWKSRRRASKYSRAQLSTTSFAAAIATRALSGTRDGSLIPDRSRDELRAAFSK